MTEYEAPPITDEQKDLADIIKNERVLLMSGTFDGHAVAYVCRYRRYGDRSVEMAPVAMIMDSTFVEKFLGKMKNATGQLLLEKPRYEHDCTNCQFLGRFEHTAEGEDKVQYDLYWCPPRHDKVTPSSVLGGSIIARFGDEGAQYGSMALDVLTTNEKDLRGPGHGTLTAALLEALDRQRKL